MQEKSEVTVGAIVVRLNGEPVTSFRAWSIASVFKSIHCGSLPDLWYVQCLFDEKLLPLCAYLSSHMCCLPVAFVLSCESS